MRRQRVADFQVRAASEDNAPLTLGAGGTAILIHPMADETELLSRLGLGPKDCVGVDLYWLRDDDVVFVQIGTAAEQSFRAPGLYGRIAEIPPRHLNLVAVVDQPHITRHVVEQTAADLLRCNWRRDALGPTLVRLTPNAGEPDRG